MNKSKHILIQLLLLLLLAGYIYADDSSKKSNIEAEILLKYYYISPLSYHEELYSPEDGSEYKFDGNSFLFSSQIHVYNNFNINIIDYYFSTYSRFFRSYRYSEQILADNFVNIGVMYYFSQKYKMNKKTGLFDRRPRFGICGNFVRLDSSETYGLYKKDFEDDEPTKYVWDTDKNYYAYHGMSWGCEGELPVYKGIYIETGLLWVSVSTDFKVYDEAKGKYIYDTASRSFHFFNFDIGFEPLPFFSNLEIKISYLNYGMWGYTKGGYFNVPTAITFNNFGVGIAYKWGPGL